MKKAFFSVWMMCIVLATGLIGQEPFWLEHKLNDAFHQTKINCIYQDRNSLIWYGTNGGLLNFDGNSIKSATFDDEAVEPNVTTMYQDKAGTHWIGLESGDIYFKQPTGKLKKWSPEEGLPKARITGFTEDFQGRLWIATYGEGLYCRNGNRIYHFGKEDGLIAMDIYQILLGPNGKIWVTTDGGVNVCTFQGDEKSIDRIAIQSNVQNHIVTAICTDGVNRIWLGTYSHGIFECEVSSGNVTKLNGVDLENVTDLLFTNNRDLWIGTQRHGLWRYHFPSVSFHEIKGTWKQLHKYISDLLLDIEGNIWVVHGSNLVYSANLQFEHIVSPVKDLQAVHQQKNGKLWVGNKEGLFELQIKNYGEYEFVEHLSAYNLNVVSLYEDEYQNLWIGTFGSGLYFYDPETRQITKFSPGVERVNPNIMSITSSSSQTWLATLGGAVGFSSKENVMNHQMDLANYLSGFMGLGTDFIYQVFIDKEGNPWFATDGKGVSVMKNGKLKDYRERLPSELKTVYSISQDENDHLWFVSDKHGLYEFDGDTTRNLGLGDGLRDLKISSVITDKKGNLLIVHKSGIDILQPEKRHFIYFDDEIGIVEMDANLNCFHATSTGYIWIGIEDRLIRYHPLDEDLSIHPRTQLNSVSIFHETIDHNSSNCFAYDRNYLSFDYVGLWYTSPSSVKYLYRLEGYDLDWKESQDRKASYSNLPAGDYTFRVKASENESFHDEPIAKYSFTILKPVWLQWWFIGTSTLMLMALVYYVIKTRDERTKKEATLKKEKIQSQFMALKAQINPHFLFNSFNTLISLIEEDQEKAVAFVENLSDFYRTILQYREKQVISFEEEVALVKNFYHLLKKRFGDNIHLSIKSTNEVAFVVPLSLQMLVENAVKHNIISKTRPLRIEICQNGDGYIIVKNNIQKKIRPVQSTKFGLQSLVTRYQLLTQRELLIQENSRTFNVSIPIIKTDKI